MKLIIIVFLAGIAVGGLFSLLRMRRISKDKKIDRFECHICDDNGCECRKEDENS